MTRVEPPSTRKMLGAPSTVAPTTTIATTIATPAVAPAPAPVGPAKAKSPWRSRLIRWTIGAAMLAEAAWLAAPTFLYRTSLRATVTAPWMSVRIPQGGRIRGLPPTVGTPLEAGQELFQVEAGQPDRRPAERLRAEVAAITRTVAAMEAQIGELDDLKGGLDSHYQDYRSARTAQAETLAAEQASKVQAAAARVKTAEYEHTLQRRLMGKGASSDIELARTENVLTEARAAQEVARHVAERHRHQLASARQGFFVGEADGGQDRVASRQRADEIGIQQAGLRARIAEQVAHREELEARLASEERHLADAVVPVLAPMAGVVWASEAAAGGEVSAGHVALEIVDPKRLSVEAIFRDADAARIRPGLPVKARLLGSSQVLQGRVIAVAARDAIEHGTIGEVRGSDAEPGTFRAIIQLDEKPDQADADDRYLIGRSVVVWADR